MLCSWAGRFTLLNFEGDSMGSPDCKGLLALFVIIDG